MEFDTIKLFLPKLEADTVFQKDLELDGSLPDDLPDISHIVEIKPKIGEIIFESDNGKTVIKSQISFGILYESDYKNRLAYAEASTSFRQRTEIAESSAESFKNAEIYVSAVSCKLLGSRRYVIRGKVVTDFSDVENKAYTAVNTESTSIPVCFLPEIIEAVAPHRTCNEFYKGNLKAISAIPLTRILFSDISVISSEISRSYEKPIAVIEAEISSFCEGENNEYFLLKSNAKTETVLADSESKNQIGISAYPYIEASSIENDEYGENKIAAVSYSINIQATEYEPEKYNCASDAFCIDRECEGATEKISGISLEEIFRGSFTVEKTFDTENHGIEKLISCNAGFIPKSVKCENGNISVEGTVTFSALCQTENGLSAFGFETEFNEQFALRNGGDIVTGIRVYASECNANVFSGESISFKAGFVISADVYGRCENTVLTSLTASDTTAESDKSLKFYYPEIGEKLWDIAKSHLKSPDEIKSDNKNAFDAENKANGSVPFIVIK